MNWEFNVSLALGYCRWLCVFTAHACIYATESSDRAQVGVDFQLFQSQWLLMRKGQYESTWLLLAL